MLPSPSNRDSMQQYTLIEVGLRMCDPIPGPRVTAQRLGRGWLQVIR